MEDFTKEQFSKFNGNDKDKPVFISLNDYVYDVSSLNNNKDKYNIYNRFFGKDIGDEMKNISDFKLIDSFKSENFPSVGKISIPKSNIMLKKNELLKFNGKNNNDTKINNSIYLGLNGNIYDVSYHGGDKFYKEGGPYEIFAGKDVSVALAKMSFDKKDIDNNNISSLNEEEKICLKNWEKTFKNKYPIVGNIIN
tara:strand:- start:581 stop:1165 length:585 start_codon:yes stop_codon:yes gene_type:complete